MEDTTNHFVNGTTRKKRKLEINGSLRNGKRRKSGKKHARDGQRRATDSKLFGT